MIVAIFHSFLKKVGRRQTRIYYHLEDNGLMYLDNLQTSFQQYVNLIQFLLTSKEGETYEEKDRLISFENICGNFAMLLPINYPNQKNSAFNKTKPINYINENPYSDYSKSYK